MLKAGMVIPFISNSMDLILPCRAHPILTPAAGGVPVIPAPLFAVKPDRRLPKCDRLVGGLCHYMLLRVDPFEGGMLLPSIYLIYRIYLIHLIDLIYPTYLIYLIYLIYLPTYRPIHPSVHPSIQSNRTYPNLPIYLPI